MTRKMKLSIRFLSLFLAMLFVFYVYPPAAMGQSVAVTEAPLYEPEPEAITEEELASLAEHREQYSDAEVIGENTELRDEAIKHYRMSDGTFRAVDYGTAVHFKDTDEEWTDFDNDLELNETVDFSDPEDFAGYEPKKNDAEIKFAKNTNSSNLLKIKYEDFQISFGLRDASKSKPVIDNGETDENDPYAVPGVTSKITYPEVFDGVDLVYIVDGSNVKEYFVISEDAAVFEYTFDIKVKNVVPSVDDEGNVVFTKDDDTVVYTIPKGYMYDSGTGYSESVTYTVEQGKNKKYTLTITANEQWITADERIYPVTVDPTVVLNKYANSSIGKSSISVAYKDMTTGEVVPNSDHIFVGESVSNNVRHNYNTRFYVSKLPDMPENTILCNASFLLWQFGDKDNDGIYGYSGAGLSELYIGAYEPASAADVYTPSSTLLDYGVYSSVPYGAFSQIDVTPSARDWYSNSSSNNGIVLSAINNTASNYANVRFFGCHPSNANDIYQPRFIVAYRHTVGVENYYTYENMSIGRAGTLYLNANTGQTVLINDIITTNNLANPYTVSLVYNSVYADTQFTYNDNAGIHTADYSKMIVGDGWKLNSQMSVTEIQLSSFIDEYYATYLIFCDGDGTEHYFEQSADNASIYKDEDGLGLKIKVLSDISNGKYEMTDDKNNITMFSHLGYVLSSTDSNGNKITYNYDTAEDQRKLTSITAQNDGGSLVTIAQFIYDDSDRLITIKDQYGRATTLKHNKKYTTVFNTIEYPDGATVNYYYYDTPIDDTHLKFADIQDNESKTAAYLYYESDGNRLAKIRSYNLIDLSDSSIITASYAGSEESTIRYSGNNGVIDNNDDTANMYHFDYWGRCTNIHTVNPYTLKVFGSSAASYTNPVSSTSKERNRISVATTTGIQPVNLLLNAGVETAGASGESTAGYFGKTGTSSGQTVARTKEAAHTGEASIKVAATTASSSELYAFCEGTGLTVGYAYTFSAYAKGVNITASTTNGGYYLKAGGVESAKLNKSISTADDNGWIKLSVSFTATSPIVELCAILKNAAGTVYFDDFQLALGDDTDQISLISNGGFDNTTSNTWGLSGAQIYTAVSNTDNQVLSGTRSIRINGDPTAAKCAFVDIPINKSASNTYVYSGWAHASSVPLVKGDKTNAPTFCLSARITYTDGSPYEWHSRSFSPDYKSWWQYVSVPIAPKEANKTIASIRLYISYDYNGNTAYFDSLSLVADNAASYKYDTNGNVISASSTKESEITASYSGADLTGYTAATGANYTYTYDSAHNVKTAKWAEVTNTLTYNSAGLPTTSTLSDITNTNKIITSANYDTYGKLTSETDQRGNKTSYTYNSTNGALELNIFPDNSRMVYRTNTSNNRPTLVYYDDPVAGYESLIYPSYSNGRLSQIKIDVNDSNTDQNYNLYYNNFGDMTKLTVGNIVLSQNTYNLHTGALATSLTPSGYTLSYNYDILGRPTTVKNGSTTMYTIKYNAHGNVAKITDSVNGSVYSYLYDSIGRTTGILKRTTGNVFEQLNTYSYDNASRLSARAFNFDFDYYDSGNPNLMTENYTYHPSTGLLSSFSPTNRDAITPTYNSLKQVSSIQVAHDGNKNYNFYKYYTYYPVSSTQTTNLPQKLQYTTANSKGDLTFEYTYDNMNNITGVKKNGSVTETYTYDDWGKLTGAEVGGYSYTYGYDCNGNLTGIARIGNGKYSTTRLYYDPTSDWPDRLIKVGSTAITYDESAPGLPVSYYNSKNSYSFDWDEYGNLKSSYSGGNLTTYWYNTDGLRAYKNTTDNVYHDYYYDGDRLIAETIGDDKYLLFHYDENGSIYSITYNNGTSSSKYYLFKNLQGDVIEIRDITNTRVATYDYDPWGNIVSIKDASGNDVSANTTHIAYINPIRYRSYYYDVETGFYYLQSRYYDPAICRFISADSLLVMDPASNGLNLFAYCGNNPVNRVDPNGMCFEKILNIIYGLNNFIETFIMLIQLNYMGFSNTTYTLAKDCINTLKSNGIDTPQEKAHFFSQCYVEGGLSTLEAGWLSEEDAYAYRASQPYYPYYGAGYIQLTWEENYRRFSEDMGDPSILSEGPVYVADNYAWSAAGWYWTSRNINGIIANGGSVREVTRAINGGYNGIDKRIEQYNIYINYFSGGVIK